MLLFLSQAAAASLATTISAASSLSAPLTVRVTMTSTIGATSTLASALTISAPLSTSIASVSSLSSALAASVSLNATINAASSLSSTLTANTGAMATTFTVTSSLVAGLVAGVVTPLIYTPEFFSRGPYFYRRSDGSGPYSIGGPYKTPRLIRGPGFGITGNFQMDLDGVGYFKDDGSGPYAKDMLGLYYLISP